MLENLRNATKSKNATKSTKNATKFGTILENVTKYRKMLGNIENATISIKMLEYLKTNLEKGHKIYKNVINLEKGQEKMSQYLGHLGKC